VFILSSGFYIANLVSLPLLNSRVPLSHLLFHKGTVLHLAASLWFGLVWLIAARAALSLTALRVLDLVALIGGCRLYGLMGASLTLMQHAMEQEAAIGLYAGVLACANTIAARAIVVPSSGMRTFWASTIATVPLIPTTYATASTAAIVNVVCWSAVSVAIATLGSRVIFGLRTEAARVRRSGSIRSWKRWAPAVWESCIAPRTQCCAGQRQSSYCRQIAPGRPICSL
jgi:hypothetical protein